MYLINLYKEIKIWRIVKSIAKENEELLNKSGFRVDWIGRIYTVINLPEEIVNAPVSQEGYVLMRLREYDKLFLELGIADVIYPEMMQIDGEYAFLLILSPNRNFLKIWPFTKFIVKFAALILIVRILYLIISPRFQDILSATNKAIDFIF
jgi:hypothetical protein